MEKKIQRRNIIVMLVLYNVSVVQVSIHRQTFPSQGFPIRSAILGSVSSGADQKPLT